MISCGSRSRSAVPIEYLKDAAQVDYLQSPETIEDICECYAMVFNRSLILAYRRATEPCVVKFVDIRPEPDCMVSAAAFLHDCARGGTGRGVIHGFDSCGVPIRPEQILSTTWLRRR